MCDHSIPLPPGAVTGIGSLPFHDPHAAVQAVARTCPIIPFWPELPRRSPEARSVEQTFGAFADLVRPRLADAKFFFDQDRKKTLASRVEGLGKVVYHNKLGTQGERAERVRRIAKAIGQQLGDDVLAQKADQAAQLAKTDLVTDMVGEFPELQGIMGQYYAQAQDWTWSTYADYLDFMVSRGVGINIAGLVGHGSVRLATMGFEERPPSPAELRAMSDYVAEAMRAARAAEYRAVTDQARDATRAGAAERRRVLRRLRGELRRIARRDFFPPADREAARAAVDALAVKPAATGKPAAVEVGP